jgi:lantibiotic biosynthesis protein
MSWRALLPAMAIADDVDAPPVDRALVRAYLADDFEPVAALVDSLDNAPPQLYNGAAGIGWAVAHLASGDDAAAVTREISRALRQTRHRLRGYDLIDGLVGAGVLALEADDPELARMVIDELSAYAGRRWFTPPDELVDSERELAPTGYTNLGMAHGIPGVIALMARFVHRGFEPRRSQQMLDDAVEMIVGVPSPTPSWLPAEGSRHLAWCYGDLGVAVALVGAGLFANHERAYARGVELARGAASWTGVNVAETGLCHGIAGVAHLFNRLAQASGEPAFEDTARRWYARLLARNDDPRDGSFLLGGGGIALALHAATTDITPDWDRLLLADLPPR